MGVRKFTDEQEQDIARRYGEGESTIQLGKAYGVAPTTIGKLLKRQGTAFAEIEVVTLTVSLTNPETGEPWSLDEQKAERLHSKRSISAAVTDGITPDRASLELTPMAIQRAVAKWATRLSQARQQQQAA